MTAAMVPFDDDRSPFPELPPTVAVADADHIEPNGQEDG